MSQKLKRRAAPARKVARQAGKASRARAARARTGSALDAVMALIPLSEEQLHGLFLAVILVVAAVLAVLVASMAGVPAMARQQVAMVAAEAGFQVRHVEVRGTRHLNEMKVYERILSQRNRAMPLVDLAALRADLLRLSWVEDARVSRQLPDTLVVDIVERRPHAVLRAGDHLALIDRYGVVLDPVSADEAKGMLMLSGEGVAEQVAALGRLLDAAPALRPQVAEAEWVGNRRWNLMFRSGQVLALPEGAQAAGDALVSFARLDGTNRLLGGRVAAFDMRAPDRIYLRVPGRSGGDGGVPVALARSAPASEAPATGEAASGAGEAASGTPLAGAHPAAVAAGAAALLAAGAAHHAGAPARADAKAGQPHAGAKGDHAAKPVAHDKPASAHAAVSHPAPHAGNEGGKAEAKVSSQKASSQKAASRPAGKTAAKADKPAHPGGAHPAKNTPHHPAKAARSSDPIGHAVHAAHATHKEDR